VTTFEVEVITGAVVLLVVTAEVVLVIVPRVVLVIGVDPPPYAMMAALSGSYQQFASLTLPLLFGWTPSVVSVDVSNPVAQSTTVIGDADVALVGAHAAIAAL